MVGRTGRPSAAPERGTQGGEHQGEMRGAWESAQMRRMGWVDSIAVCEDVEHAGRVEHGVCTAWACCGRACVVCRCVVQVM